MEFAEGDAVGSARRSVARLVLPLPQAVPVAPLAATDLGRARWTTLQGLRLDVRADAAALAAEIARGLACLPDAPAGPDPLDVLTAAEPHDAYFRIGRTHEPIALAWPRALLQSLAIWRDEAECGGDAADALAIGDALVGLWHASVAPDAAVLTDSTATNDGAPHTLPPAGTDRIEPVRRWLRGHQVFGMLTQGLVFAAHRFEAASIARDRAGIAAALAHVVRLYDASAAAFRFTADFDAWHYTELIRPSMSEPHAPAGFSGTMSPDHGVLVGRLSALRPAFAAAAEHHAPLCSAMRLALARLYDDHKRVCERLAGAGGPSLRSGAQAGQPAAAEMLDRFKARRLGMLT